MIDQRLDRTKFEGISIDEMLEELAHRFNELGLLGHPRGCDIEIVESWSEHNHREPPGFAIKPNLVRINGVDVGLIAKNGGIEVDVGSDIEPASFTVKLYPKSITIKAE